MPGILSDINRIFDGTKERDNNTSPQIIEKANNFSNLSLNVQKILSNILDADNDKFDTTEFEQKLLKRVPTKRVRPAGRFSPEGALYKSEESLDLISPNVQKMLSNLPDTELVIANTGSADKKTRNGTLLRANLNENKNSTARDPSDQVTSSLSNLSDTLLLGDSDYMLAKIETGNCEFKNDKDACSNVTFVSKPLGNYNQTLPGIAARTPVGRKNMGKYLQVSQLIDSFLKLNVYNAINNVKVNSVFTT